MTTVMIITMITITTITTTIMNTTTTIIMTTIIRMIGNRTAMSPIGSPAMRAAWRSACPSWKR